MKILFNVHHPGFIRHFQQALGLLCDEGHAVHIAFHSDKFDADQWTQELRQAHPEITISTGAPRRSDEWTRFSNRIRAMRDYTMYFDARYAGADRLRANAAREVHAGDRPVVDRVAAIPELRFAFNRLLNLAERAIPSDPDIDAFLTGHAPDIILVTPLVMFNSPQVDVIKSARELGIPTALCVASWDNLTNKGKMRELPDRVMVWNEAQREEAVSLHGMLRHRVVVTGAQSFDHWFEFEPSRSKRAFLSERGLDPETDLILYLCSSTSISPNEIELIRQWQGVLRQSPDPRVAKAAILVRPHPVNKQPWEQLDEMGLENFAVWPRDWVGPFDPQSRNDYFDSLYHASAVVGLNTSGQVEAGLIGRPVLTLLTEECPLTLRGTTDTLHFRHLLQADGGLLHVAYSFKEHVQHLSKAIGGDPSMVERSRRFTETFIRPHGLAQPCAPILADAIRSLATVKPAERLADRWLSQAILRPFLRTVRHLRRFAAHASSNVVTAKEEARTVPMPEKARED